MPMWLMTLLPLIQQAPTVIASLEQLINGIVNHPDPAEAVSDVSQNLPAVAEAVAANTPAAGP